MSWFDDFLKALERFFGSHASPPPPPPPLPPPPPPPPPSPLSPWKQVMNISTSHGSVLLTTIPLSYPTYAAYAVMACSMPARKSGDVSILKATGEISSTLPYSVMVGHYISLAAPVGTALPVQATPARGFDIAPPVMHDPINEILVVDDFLFNRLGMPLTQPAYTAYLILYTASTAETPGVTITFNFPGYAEMVGTHFQV